MREWDRKRNAEKAKLCEKVSVLERWDFRFGWKTIKNEFVEGNNLKIVAVCGSMKFENEMKKIAFILETKYDMCVLQCVYNEDKLKLSEDEIIDLNAAHLKKIELADAIYVVDLHGYIGKQTEKEIMFAQSLDKEVIFHSEFFMNG